MVTDTSVIFTLFPDVGTGSSFRFAGLVYKLHELIIIVKSLEVIVAFLSNELTGFENAE